MTVHDLKTLREASMVSTEKILEAIIDDLVSEIGDEAASNCFVLQRLVDVMLEMKSCNNAEILREIGYARHTHNRVTTACKGSTCTGKGCGGIFSQDAGAPAMHDVAESAEVHI